MARSYISRVALASFVVCIILHPITINGDTDSTEESTSEELTSEMSATSTVEITGSTEITTASTGTVPTESKGSTAESTFGTTQNSTTGNMTTEAETPTQGGPEATTALAPCCQSRSVLLMILASLLARAIAFGTQ